MSSVRLINSANGPLAMALRVRGTGVVNGEQEWNAIGKGRNRNGTETDQGVVNGLIATVPMHSDAGVFSSPGPCCCRPNHPTQ